MYIIIAKQSMIVANDNVGLIHSAPHRAGPAAPRFVAMKNEYMSQEKVAIPVETSWLSLIDSRKNIRLYMET